MCTCIFVFRGPRGSIGYVDKSVILVKYCINNRINKLTPRLHVVYDYPTMTVRCQLMHFRAVSVDMVERQSSYDSTLRISMASTILQ